MKKTIMAITLLSSINLVAATPQSILCRNDERMNGGPLRELILVANQNGYAIQSTFAPSLNAPNMVIEQWAGGLACRIDEKSTLAFCQNPTDQSVAQIKERREVFYDSVEVDAKKKTIKHIDISIQENGVEKHAISFAASHCQLFGGED